MRVSNHVHHVISSTSHYRRNAVIETLEYSPNFSLRNTTCMTGNRGLQIINGSWFISIASVLQIAPEKTFRGNKSGVWGTQTNEVRGIIGPYLFEDSAGRVVTINSERYINLVLKKFWTCLGARRHVVQDYQRFQLDGATPQTSHQSMEWLRYKFGAKLISHKTPIVWAPQSPVLSPLDFFLVPFEGQVLY